MAAQTTQTLPGIRMSILRGASTSEVQLHQGPIPRLRHRPVELVNGGIHLLAGSPGTRKSGFALQLGLDRGASGLRSLILLTEESEFRVVERAMRMLGGKSRATNKLAMANIAFEETSVEAGRLVRHVDQLVLGPDSKHRGVDLVILDSIQGGGISSSADTLACRSALEMATRLRSAGIATLLVGHVTKQNLIRGPRSLEHAVDTVLLLDRRGGRRTLTIPKNRFGPAMFKPMALAIDPVTTRIAPAPHGLIQVATVRAFVPGIGMAKLQVAASLPRTGDRGRLAPCRGIPAEEVSHVLRCLRRTPGFDTMIDELDWTVACRWQNEDVRFVRGQSVRTALLHVPLGLAIAGACMSQDVPSDIVAAGELDLAGRVYATSPNILNDLTSALREGELRGTRLLCPSIDMRFLPWNCGCTFIGVDTIDGAVRRMWPEVESQALCWDC